MTVAVTSGKGGVGKSQLAASLAVIFRQAGHQTLMVDADVGCGNLDVLLGVRPEVDLRAMLRGERTVEEIVTTACLGGLRIDLLAAPGPDRNGAELQPGEQLAIIDAVARVGAAYEFVLIDTGAGVSRNPMLFGAAADRILLVTTPEPTAIKDAYAAIKVLYQAHRIDRIDLVVNMTQGPADAKRTYAQLSSVVERFLPVQLTLAGMLPYDDRVMRAVRARSPAAFEYPTSAWSHAVRKLAQRLLSGSELGARSSGNVNFVRPVAAVGGVR
jgi:flagellar biosynthesis protein FlhG